MTLVYNTDPVAFVAVDLAGPCWSSFVPMTPGCVPALSLRCQVLYGNPAALCYQYRRLVLTAMPALQSLDDIPVPSDDDRASGEYKDPESDPGAVDYVGTTVVFAVTLSDVVGLTLAVDVLPKKTEAPVESGKGKAAPPAKKGAWACTSGRVWV